MNKKIFLGSLLVFFIDQISKALIFHVGRNMVVIPRFFNISLVYNDGGAFSILGGYRFLFIVFTIVCLFFIYRFSKECSFRGKVLVFSLLYGGVLGNLFDRIYYGKVRDFLDFNIFGYSFPTFNGADIAIVLACAWLLVYFLRKKDSNGKDNG